MTVRVSEQLIAAADPYFATAADAYESNRTEDARRALASAADAVHAAVVAHWKTIREGNERGLDEFWETEAREQRGKCLELGGTIAESWADVDGALDLYTRSAEAGWGTGMISVARVAHARGDLATAKRWYQEATNFVQWDQYAASRLIAIAEEENDAEAAVHWKKLIAEWSG